MSVSQKLQKQADVHRLPVPAEGEAVFFDEGKDRALGLALRIRPSGSRSWCFFYRQGGKQRKMTIGDPATWSLDGARAEARKLRVVVDRGGDPAADKRKATEQAATEDASARLTFLAVAKEYLKAKSRTMRASTLEETTRYLMKQWQPLHGLQIDNITQGMVAAQPRAIIDEKGRGAVAANRARSALSAMFRWARGEAMCTTNPVRDTNKVPEKSRSRVLTNSELVAVWRALPDNDFGRCLRLLMLTGARRQEIGGLRWSEIDLEKKQIVVPGDRVKNGHAFELPLCDAAIDILKAQPRILGRPNVFGEGESGLQGYSKPKSRLDAALKLDAPWTVHDIRRSVVTGMADIGVQPHIIEAVVNHLSGHKGGIAGVYNRSTYAPEKREALDRWANHLKVELAKAEGTNVISIGTRA